MAGAGGWIARSGLKVWVCKVGGLACDKNAQLKEAAVQALASTYTNVDAAAIVNYVNGVPGQVSGCWWVERCGIESVNPSTRQPIKP